MTDYGAHHSLHSALRAILPRWVLRDLELGPYGISRSVEATLLFADITDFTPTMERLQSRGPQGNEDLTTIVNAFFTGMVAVADAWGGDVLAFAGDALLVAFIGPDHTMRSASAALAMQQALTDLNPFKVASQRIPINLTMKIGIASGPLFLADVGTAQRRIALSLGTVLITMDANAENLAAGKIRLDAQTAAQIDPDAELAYEPDGRALLVALQAHRTPAAEAAGSAPVMVPLDSDALLERIIRLSRYMPEPVLEYLSAQDNAWLSAGEQRNVVSLFTSLVGLHAVADAYGATDPGLVTALVEDVFTRAIEIVERNGGILAYVDIYTEGHKLLALFGAPTARENDAYWATDAALKLSSLAFQSLDKIATERGGQHAQPASEPELAPLRVYTGLHTGSVFAGLAGSSTRYAYTVNGSSVNIAARLMGLASRDGHAIISSAALCARIKARLETSSWPAKLKGVSEPIPVCTIHSLDRLPQRRVLSTKLVGRDAQFTLLQQVAQELNNGNRRMLIIRGPAGIGKTRLSHELHAQVRERLPNALCCTVLLPSQSAPSYAVFEELVRLLADAEADRAATYAEWVDLLEQTAADPHLELRHTIGALLRLPGSDIGPMGPTVELQQAALARAIQAMLSVIAQHRPVAIFIEDLHNADERSLMLLEELLQLSWQGWQGRLLVCITTRPAREAADEQDIVRPLQQAARQSFGPRWQLIELSPLDPVASGALLAELLKALEPARQEELIGRAGGNPLFLELLAEEVQRGGVPSDLEDLIAAQFDRLSGAARQLASAAAVIAVMSPEIEPWLAESVAAGYTSGETWQELLEAGVLVASNPNQSEIGQFRHNLFQERAYARLLERKRRELHRKVAEVLDGQGVLADLTLQARYLTAVANHAYVGLDDTLALRYSLIVGQQARLAYNYREARLYLNRTRAVAHRLKQYQQHALALEELGTIYAQSDRFKLARRHLQHALVTQQLAPAGEQFEAQARRYRWLALVGERTASGPEEYAQAAALCRHGLQIALALPRPRIEAARLYTQLGEILMRSSQYNEVREACEAGLRELPADTVSYPRERAALTFRLATILGERGRYAEAISELTKCLVLAVDAGDLTLQSMILNNRGLFRSNIALREEALADHTESMRLKERLRDVAGRVSSLINIGGLLQVSGRYDEALDALTQAQELCERHHLSEERRARVIATSAEVRYVQGRLEQVPAILAEAAAGLAEALAIFERLAYAYAAVDALYRLGDVELALGNPDMATTYGERALELARKLDSAAYESCALRVLGEAMLTHSRYGQAAELLYQALKAQHRPRDPYDRTLNALALAQLARAQGQTMQALRWTRAGLRIAHQYQLPFQKTLLERLLIEFSTMSSHES